MQNKYCYRQAEMGVGDCGGLRVSSSIIAAEHVSDLSLQYGLLCTLQLIPGMTKSGKQKTPEWLKKVLGQEEGK